MIDFFRSLRGRWRAAGATWRDFVDNVRGDNREDLDESDDQ